MYKHLSRFLTENNLKNYSIGQHQGKCTSPFIVISDEGERGISGYSITYREIDLILLYPLGKYSQIEDYIEEVKNKECECCKDGIKDDLKLVEILLQSVATSIDALAVGISL